MVIRTIYIHINIRGWRQGLPMNAALWIIEGLSQILPPETHKIEHDMNRVIIFILLILGLLSLSGYMAIIY